AGLPCRPQPLVRGVPTLPHGSPCFASQLRTLPRRWGAVPWPERSGWGRCSRRLLQDVQADVSLHDRQGRQRCLCSEQRLAASGSPLYCRPGLLGQTRRAGSRRRQRLHPQGTPHRCAERVPMTLLASVGEVFSQTALSGPMLLAIPVSILAGAVSFFSPCVLPLVPGYIGYVTGLGAEALTERKTSKVVIGVALFIAGFAMVFVSMGLVFSLAGVLLSQWA